MGWNGGDRGNRQQCEQAVERLALVGVDGRKHVFERGHESPRRAARARRPAAIARASSRPAARLQLGRAVFKKTGARRGARCLRA